MKNSNVREAALKTLDAARRVATHAESEGALNERKLVRATCMHLGAVLADSILQAGLNYTTVVRPRVTSVMQNFSDAKNISILVSLISEGKTGDFLSWKHQEKITRFESLVYFLKSQGLENIDDLIFHLNSDEFCSSLQELNGIGPKTVDYMACLVGIDSIAVDRHVRLFAKESGIDDDDYQFLKKSFCYAADLLSISRREFDSWLWRRGARQETEQLELFFY